MRMKVERNRVSITRNDFLAARSNFAKAWRERLPISDSFQKCTCAGPLGRSSVATSNVKRAAQATSSLTQRFSFFRHPPVAGLGMRLRAGFANENLPAVVLQKRRCGCPHGGVGLFSSGFPAAQHQASILKADVEEAVANVRPRAESSVPASTFDFCE